MILLAHSVAASISAQPRLEVLTAEGQLEIELLPDAAPAAVARLVDGLVSNGHGGAGLYSDAEIDHAWPLVEIGIATRDSKASTIEVAQELGASALGLPERKIRTAGEAMDVLQFELTKADARWKRTGKRPQRYSEWLQQWHETGSANFLIGVSRKEINEVLGYRYVQGLATRPARRGAVYLDDRSPTTATLALKILLADRPDLHGRVTVIGHVSAGLPAADDISRRPLVVQGGKQTKIPVDPVPIIDIRLLEEP